jgi:hypothetical protein
MIDRRIGSPDRFRTRTLTPTESIATTAGSRILAVPSEVHVTDSTRGGLEWNHGPSPGRVGLESPRAEGDELPFVDPSHAATTSSDASMTADTLTSRAW